LVHLRLNSSNVLRRRLAFCNFSWRRFTHQAFPPDCTLSSVGKRHANKLGSSRSRLHT
jgi:hypothetical protein